MRRVRRRRYKRTRLRDREPGVVQGDRRDRSPTRYYRFEAKPDATLTEIEQFRTTIEKIQKAKDVPFELAATYNAFRQMGYDHAERFGEPALGTTA